MVMEAVLANTDFRKVSRLLLADGWHNVLELRWVEPLINGATVDHGIASEWVSWWETDSGGRKIQRTIFAPTSSVLAYSFSSEP
jgi:hypothetical protein